MQILPDIYLVNGFPYSQHQNAYLLKLGDKIVMIDSGDLATNTFDVVKESCAIWGITLDQVDYLLLTHSHFDHASHASRLQKLGAKIIANQDCAEALASGDERCIGYAVGNRDFETCEVDQVISNDEIINIGGQDIRCIEAPGHAKSCVIYELIINGQRLWFSGDQMEIGPECKSLTLCWEGGRDYDRPTYIKTLERLSQMPCDSLFPGHGPPCLATGKKMLEMAYEKVKNDWA